MSGPSLPDRRTVTLRTIELECSCESPALAEALFVLMQTHTRAHGFGNAEGVETTVKATFTGTTDTKADLEGLRAKVNELWLGGVMNIKTEEVEVLS